MAPAQETLTIVMPVYNEDEIISTVIESWLEVLRKLGVQFTFLALNDGSKDNTQAELASLAKNNPELNVINKPNSGHGPTILDGYRSASTYWVFQVDSDNEISAEEFPKIWEKRYDQDLVLGIRTNRTSPLSRRLISLVSKMTVLCLYGRGVVDVNAPFRLYRTERFTNVFHNIPPSTFAPNVILAGYATNHRMKICEVAIAIKPRATGEVSIKKWKLVKAAVKAFGQTIGFRFSDKFKL
jgi:dolichol-phosphate mannosyltransferase